MPRRTPYRDFENLVDLLEQFDAGETITRTFICERYGVREACAYRMMDFLEAMRGDSVITSRHNRSKALRRKPDAPGDLSRATLLKLAEMAVTPMLGTDTHRRLLSLYQTERRQLDPQQAELLVRLEWALHHRARPALPSAPGTLDRWIDALQHHRHVHLRYQRQDGEEHEYIIEPLTLLLHRDLIYLRARRTETNQVRTFVLDGVLSCDVLDTTFPPPTPDEVDPGRVFRRAFGIWLPEHTTNEPVKLEVRGPVLHRLRRRPVHPSQRIVVGHGGWCRVELDVDPCPELLGWVLSALPDVRVQGPETLRHSVRRTLDEARAAHGDPHPS